MTSGVTRDRNGFAPKAAINGGKDMALITQTRAREIAADVMRGHETGARFRPFARELGLADLPDAYAVQREYTRLIAAKRGASPAGYKVGLTSPRMQAMCGIDVPIRGLVFADVIRESGARLRPADYGRLGLEFEIAARMKRDLRPTRGPVRLADVAAAVAAVAPAFEIVDDRHCDYETLDVLSLVADNSWNAGIVLGAFHTTWPDLAAAACHVSVDGVEIDHGVGGDVLGHPFESIAWLANHLAETGGALRAGDIVMTGNMVTTMFPTPGARVEMRVEGLGSVEATVEG